MGSTRLPGKVSKLILGKPMLVHQIERVKQARLIDTIVIATTVKGEDDIVARMAQEAGVECFRGSESDVLDRYYQAAREARVDIVIRITGDCPFSDPKVIDETIEYFLRNGEDIDYTSKPSNYPEGLDMEIFSFNTLERAWKEAVKPSEREHVTPYIYNHPEIFRVRTWQNDVEDLSAMHWSVDTPEDFAFVTKVFELLYPIKQFFSKNDILALLLKNPDLLNAKSRGTGYEGYTKSLEGDKVFNEKQSFYENIIGFAPELIILLSAGTVKEIREDGTVSYRSTRVDEGDMFGVLWGEARTLATAELAINFPKSTIVTTSVRPVLLPGEPTHASVLCDELVNLSVSRDRVILEERSTNTLSQISEAIKIICEKKVSRVVFITNEYQINRVRAIYENIETLLPVDTEAKCAAREIMNLEVQVQFIPAESILPHHDKKFVEIIAEMKKSPAYIKRLQNEEKGVAMIKSGEYGRKEVPDIDKVERLLC